MTLEPVTLVHPRNSVALRALSFLHQLDDLIFLEAMHQF
jgi:hypothetical protein